MYLDVTSRSKWVGEPDYISAACNAWFERTFFFFLDFALAVEIIFCWKEGPRSNICNQQKVLWGANLEQGKQISSSLWCKQQILLLWWAKYEGELMDGSQHISKSEPDTIIVN